MVNSPSPDDSANEAGERRERPRASAEHAPALGAANPNPFGDLVTLQHLSARLAKALRPVFEGLSRQKLRCWAEPLVVQRWSDYRTERGDAPAAWAPLAMQPGKGRALLVLDGRHVHELLDSFFGGDGDASGSVPVEFTPAAAALVARVAQAVIAPLESAWEPVTRIGFRYESVLNLAAAPDLGDDAVVVTRFGLAEGEHKPMIFDIIYPVAALKPHVQSLTAKVQDQTIEVEPEWRSGLTRAAMGIRLPVRSVLAEPILALGKLVDLKPGDVIPIEFGAEVPVMVANQRLGTGQVGTANGRAAVRMTNLAPINPEDFR